MKKGLLYLLFLMTASCLQEIPQEQGIPELSTTDQVPLNIIVAGSRAPGVALETVNTGTGPNTGTGDPLRTAFTKINDAIIVANDVELYNVTSPIQTQLNARSRFYSDTMKVSAGVLRIKPTTLTTEPYSVQIFTSGGKNITHAVSDSVALNGGVYKLYVYSVDSLAGCKLKILY